MDEQQGQQPPPPPPVQWVPPPPPPKPMSRGKALALWILGGVLLLAFAVASALGEDDPARAAGAATGTILIALAVAAGIRYAVTRSNPHERIWSPWLLLIAAGVALLPALNNLADAADDAQSVADCRENTNPQGRFESLPAGMVAETLDAETQAGFNKLAGPAAEATGADVHARRISQNGQPLGAAIVITVPEDEREGFVNGFTESAAEKGGGAPRDVEVGEAEQGKEVAVDTAEGKLVMVTGFAGCHALTAVTLDSATSRQIVIKMAEAPES